MNFYLLDTRINAIGLYSPSKLITNQNAESQTLE